MACHDCTTQCSSLGNAERRAKWHSWMWWLLPVVIGLGWVYPVVGVIVPFCWIGALVMASFRGRVWCDYMCPRAGLHDHVVTKIRRSRTVPAFFKHPAVRIGVLAFFMSVLAIRLPAVWGDWAAVGGVFVFLLTATTIASVLMGVLLHQRAWCTICPAGTMANWIGRGKGPALQMDQDACTDCGACAAVCPLDLRPRDQLRSGSTLPADCLKCGLCVDRCPKDALALAARGEAPPETMREAG